MNTLSYSKLFNTLYDQQEPVGRLGRGTHYSVLEGVQWVDSHRKPLRPAALQRFAVIWDEDHDTRVIQVIEAAYMRGIFAPVLYVGERKAILTVVVSDEFYDHIQSDWVSYTEAWQNLSEEIHGDFWTFDLVPLSHAAKQLVAADEAKVDVYLKNIDNLWSLGHNAYQAPNTR